MTEEPTPLPTPVGVVAEPSPAQYIVNAQGALHSVNSPYTFGPGERSATAAEIAAYQAVYENAELASVSYPGEAQGVPVSNPPHPPTTWKPGDY